MNKILVMLIAFVSLIVAPAMAYTTTQGTVVSNSDISNAMYSSLITNPGVKNVIVSTEYSHIDALVQVDHDMAWNLKEEAVTKALYQYGAVIRDTNYSGYLQIRMYCASCGIQYQRVWEVTALDMPIGSVNHLSELIGSSYVTNIPRYYDKAGDITKDVVYEGTRYSAATGDWL